MSVPLEARRSTVTDVQLDIVKAKAANENMSLMPRIREFYTLGVSSIATAPPHISPTSNTIGRARWV